MEQANHTNPVPEKKWYQKLLGIVAMVILWPFFAIWAIWKKTNMNRGVKLVLTALFIFMGLLYFSLLSVLTPGSDVKKTETGQEIKSDTSAQNANVQNKANIAEEKAKQEEARLAEIAAKEEVRKQAEEEAKKKKDEEAQIKAEEEKRRQEEEKARIQAEEEKKKEEDAKSRTSEAWVCAKNKMESSLKAPSTADFPWFDYTVVALGDNKYLVKSYVDAQNGFGAKIRTNFICEVVVVSLEEAISSACLATTKCVWD